MKKSAIIFSVFLVFFIAGKAISAPMYTDELPQEYINQVKSSKKINGTTANPNYDKEKDIPVSVYSPQNVRFKLSPRIENLYIVYKISNYKINDELTFLVAEDVYKNGKLIIKQNTPTTGVIKRIDLNADNSGAPSEFIVSGFKVQDINNNTILLYGSVVNKYDKPINNLRHAINKNDLYTLYCK